MTAFVKPALFAGLCVGCLALGGGAQTPPPAPLPAPPLTTIPALPAVAGQGGSVWYTPRATTVGGNRLLYVNGYSAAEAEATRLAQQIVETKSDDDKDKLRDKMQEVLGKAFEEKQKHHEKEIAALEAQVKKLKEMVSKRSKAKREIIDEHMKQLERGAAGLGW